MKKITKDFQIVVNQDQIWFFEFISAFPQLSFILPASCSNILNIDVDLSELKTNSFLREISDFRDDKSIQTLGDENFWLQLLGIQSLSDENTEDFKKRKSIMKRTFSSNLVQLIILHHVKNCLKNYLDLDFTN